MNELVSKGAMGVTLLVSCILSILFAYSIIIHSPAPLLPPTFQRRFPLFLELDTLSPSSSLRRIVDFVARQRLAAAHPSVTFGTRLLFEEGEGLEESEREMYAANLNKVSE